MSAEDLDWTSSALSPYAELTDPGQFWDEVIGPEGVRDQQQIISAAVQGMGMSGLLAARAEARRLIDDDGVHYGGSLNPKKWMLDPIPMVIDSEEWKTLEAGVSQRLQVLNALLEDIYGAQRLMHSGVLPPEIVLGHLGFLHQAHGAVVPGEQHLGIVGTDLARASDGQWLVLSDRTAAPSGAGYAMVNRRITSRVMADLHRGTRLRRLRSFFTTMRQSLLTAAPEGGHAPRGALLWSGSASETAYEQGFLATLLGFSLVEADDLTVRDATLWVHDGDRRTRVDVLLRRIDSAYCDPLEFRPDSKLGVAGLLEASRRGRLGVANRLGSGVLENAGLLSFLPQVCRALLGEELLLPSSPTWWCGDPVQRQHVLANLDELVVKPIDRGVGILSRPGWSLSQEARAELIARIEHEPWAWVAQDPVLTSTTPVVTSNGLVPRHTVLRTFAVATGDTFQLMPGGLARVAPSEEAWQISSGMGALSKDVWVLDSEDSVPAAMAQPSFHEPMLWVEGADPRPLPARVADNLYWYGRYGERVDSTTRLLTKALDLSEDYGKRVGSNGYQVLHIIRGAVSSMTALPPESDGPAASSRQVLRRAATDPQLAGSLAHDIGNLVRSAHEVPDILSGDIWPLVSRLERAMGEAAEDLELGEITSVTMAIAGLNAESMVRDNTWAFIDAGVRVERATNALWLLSEVFSTDQPMTVEDQAAEALMVVCESQITHHRRLAAGTGPFRPMHAALALLVLDQANPRSVAFQLAKLVQDMHLVNDDTVAAHAQHVLDELVSNNSGPLMSGSRAEIAAILHRSGVAMRELSLSIAKRHFTRPAPRVFRQTAWLTPVEPRLRP